MITLDEAVKQLSGAGETGAFTYDQKFKDACKLGKEGLQLIKHTRQNSQKPAYTRLPSEAEE